MGTDLTLAGGAPVLLQKSHIHERPTASLQIEWVTIAMLLFLNLAWIQDKIFVVYSVLKVTLMIIVNALRAGTKVMRLQRKMLALRNRSK